MKSMVRVDRTVVSRSKSLSSKPMASVLIEEVLRGRSSREIARQVVEGLNPLDWGRSAISGIKKVSGAVFSFLKRSAVKVGLTAWRVISAIWGKLRDVASSAGIAIISTVFKGVQRLGRSTRGRWDAAIRRWRSRESSGASVPLVLLYSKDENGKSGTLSGTYGKGVDKQVIPPIVVPPDKLKEVFDGLPEDQNVVSREGQVLEEMLDMAMELIAEINKSVDARIAASSNLTARADAARDKAKRAQAQWGARPAG